MTGVLFPHQFIEPTRPQRFCHCVCYASQIEQLPNDRACWHEIFCIGSCCLLSTAVKNVFVNEMSFMAFAANAFIWWRQKWQICIPVILTAANQQSGSNFNHGLKMRKYYHKILLCVRIRLPHTDMIGHFTLKYKTMTFRPTINKTCNTLLTGQHECFWLIRDNTVIHSLCDSHIQILCR